MTPLFITSFKCVRKRMKAKKWKRLQQLAYLFYMLIYVHVMLLMLPMALEGDVSYIINVFVYSCVFLTYATLRLWKFYKKTKKQIAIALIIMMYLLVAIVIACGLSNTMESQINENNSTEYTVEEVQEDILEENIEDSNGIIDAEIAEVESEEVPSIYDIDLSNIPDGTYTGIGEGYSGDVVVTVTMLEGVMESISLDKHTDDESYMDKATWIRKYMMKEQTINVDAISGATYGSIGIKNAVLNTLTIDE